LIYERILHFAESTPDRTAIRRNGVDLSFRSFAGTILAARAEFARLPLSSEKIVAIAAVDIQKYWICALSLRSLGVTVLPIRSPDDLLQMNVPGIKFVVGNPRWAHLIKRCQELDLLLVPLPDLSHSSLATDLPSLSDGGQLLLTSGTTGRSKMVLWDAPADEGALQWVASEVDADTMYHVFDYGPWTAAGYLIPAQVWAHGGGVIVNQGRARYEALQDPDATHALLLPFFLSEILMAPEGAFKRSDRLKIFLAGGTVSTSQLAETKRRISLKVFNRFGSTEVGGVACTTLDNAKDRKWHQIQADRGVQIVDDQHQLLPVGRLGQLRVRVGSGPSEYHNDPESTADFFHDGYFYPGDLAVMRADGCIALEGRTSEVVNVDGRKIATGQYEDQIRDKYGFTGVCLLSAQDEHGEEKIYAIVESARRLDERVVQSLRASVKGVTLNVCSIGRLPRTGTGKVMRREVQARILAALAAEQQDTSRTKSS
jgi:acyl-coenzyme A synthetase/AMP-(fatty) acid ligase